MSLSFVTHQKTGMPCPSGPLQCLNVCSNFNISTLIPTARALCVCVFMCVREERKRERKREEHKHDQKRDAQHKQQQACIHTINLQQTNLLQQRVNATALVASSCCIIKRCQKSATHTHTHTHTYIHKHTHTHKLTQTQTRTQTFFWIPTFLETHTLV